MFGGKGAWGRPRFPQPRHTTWQKREAGVGFLRGSPGFPDGYLQEGYLRKRSDGIMPNLYAQEIDADRRVKEYQQEIRKKILDMYGMEKIPEEVESYIAAAAAEPAMEESAILMRWSISSSGWL